MKDVTARQPFERRDRCEARLTNGTHFSRRRMTRFDNGYALNFLLGQTLRPAAVIFPRAVDKGGGKVNLRASCTSTSAGTLHVLEKAVKQVGTRVTKEVDETRTHSATPPIGDTTASHIGTRRRRKRSGKDGRVGSGIMHVRAKGWRRVKG